MVAKGEEKKKKGGWLYKYSCFNFTLGEGERL